MIKMRARQRGLLASGAFCQQIKKYIGIGKEDESNDFEYRRAYTSRGVAIGVAIACRHIYRMSIVLVYTFVNSARQCYIADKSRGKSSFWQMGLE